MEEMKDQIKSELRLLPFMLAKLIGAAMTVIGFPGVIIIITRRPNPTFSNILPYLLIGIFGISIFLLSSRLLVKRIKETADSARQSKYPTSLISWSIFAALAAVFILITYLMTR